MSFVEKSFKEPKSQKLHVVNPRLAIGFITQLKGQKTLDIIEIESIRSGRKMIEDGKARVVLNFEKESASAPLVLRAIYDEEDLKSKVLVGGLDEIVGASNSVLVGELLDRAGISKLEREPVKLKRDPLPKKEESAGSSVAGFLPYLIVIWAFYGGFGLASESVAAEKEKNTLETLLIAPISRKQIAFGKFLSLFTVSLMGCLVSVATMLILGPRMGGTTLFPSGFGLTLPLLAAILGVVLPLCAMFAGLLLAISAFSKNTRECQTYLTFVSFIVLIPAVFSQFIGFTDFARAQWVAFVPVLNSATILRQALLGQIDSTMALITVASSCLLAAVAIYFAMRMFLKESILTKS